MRGATPSFIVVIVELRHRSNALRLTIVPLSHCYEAEWMVIRIAPPFIKVWDGVTTESTATE